MDESYITKYNVIDRYLRKSLDAKELQDFECLLLEDEELLRDVQRNEALMAAMKGEKRSLEPNSPSKVFLPFSQWIFQPLSMAALVVVLVSIAIVFQTSSPIFPGEQDSAMYIASNLLLEPSRGESTSITAVGRAPLLITIDVGPATSSDTYQFSLIEEAGMSTVISEANARVDNEGWLRILVNQNLEGNYTVTLGKDSAAPVSYSVTFTK